MTLAQLNIRLADILIVLGIFATASAVFFGGIGWAFTYFGSDRFRWSRFAAVSAFGLAFAVLTGIAVSHLGIRAAELGSKWYSPEVAGSTMQEIMGRLSDDAPRRRQGAAQQLGGIGPGAAAALPALQEMAGSDPDARCRKAAAASVRAIQPPTR